MYRPLKEFAKQTDELKQLIVNYPDYPIVVLCNGEVCIDYDFSWWYAPHLSFGIGEILDCEQEVNDEKVYFDRDDFEDDLVNMLADSGEYDETTDEEFDKIVKEKLAEYEHYWKNVIEIRADV